MAVDLTLFNLPSYDSIIEKINGKELTEKIIILRKELSLIQYEHRDFIQKNPQHIYTVTPTVQLTILKIQTYLKNLEESY